ncbi:MAG TPA: histidinol-phosphate transaminase [Cyclobacteriaceae bacterium]
MKQINIDELARPHLRSLIPYSSARSEYEGPAEIFLDANENALGSVVGTYNRYPDPYQKKIKKKLSDIKSVLPNQIFIGNGSDEAIDLLIRTFCEPKKDNILIFPPTYGMYKVSAMINEVGVTSQPLTPEFELNTNELRNKSLNDVKLIFICSPNNPSGNRIPTETIKSILDNYNKIVVLDEAYIDFSNDESLIALIRGYNNLVILQTFSKAWGLAGLRMGMAYSNSEIINLLNKIKPPYNLNEPAQKIILEALNQKDRKEDMVKEIHQERTRLLQALQALNITQKVYPSDANFLLVKFNNAKKIFNYLINQSIIVRDRSNVILCENCLRITVGTNYENNKLIKALKRFH